MPSITLKLDSAKLFSGVNRYGFPSADYRWMLSFTSQLGGWPERLTLSSGEEQKDLVVLANFKSSGSKYKDWLQEKHGVEKEEIIGLLHYHSARTDTDGDYTPPTLFFEVETPELLLDDLIDLATRGLTPPEVVYSLASDRGVEYGWEPDGSGKKWDTAKFPIVPITGATFSVPLQLNPAPVEQDEDAHATPPASPPSRNLEPLMQRIITLLTWALVALAFIAVALVFRH